MARTSPTDVSERTLKIVHRQQAVTDAMRFAELVVSHCDKACREAMVLAASELAENVAKYGAQNQDPGAGTISVSVAGNVTRIRATNTVTSPDDAQHVLNIVRRMAAKPSNVAELYRERLRELFDKPGTSRARLGLLRLAFEGGLRVSASFEPPLLEIVAERACRNG
jgi:anti-sigma regulatory factor (Ser/Thr protein kinase)